MPSNRSSSGLSFVAHGPKNNTFFINPLQFQRKVMKNELLGGKSVPSHTDVLFEIFAKYLVMVTKANLYTA